MYWMEEELIFSSASKFSFSPPLFKILIITANWQAKPTTIGIRQASASQTFCENMIINIASSITTVLTKSGS